MGTHSLRTIWLRLFVGAHAATALPMVALTWRSVQIDALRGGKFGSESTTSQGTYMIDDAVWQRELVAALHLEKLFIAQQLMHVGAQPAVDLEPSLAESERAVTNISDWRTYLPAPCVTKMIDDGWQWST